MSPDRHMTPGSAYDPATADLRKLFMSGLGLAPAGANVIMQLARLPIGHGVAESKVHTGSLYKHPIKRTRTTLGYVMIALFGSDDERAVLRREVNRQHRQVRSQVDSGIEYDARDPKLQLWVAACMYRGLVDAASFLYGPLDGKTLDLLFEHSSRFATTLQTPASMWPVDRDAFEHYWESSLRHIVMDEVTRTYLYGIASLTFLPIPIRWVLGPPHRFVTAGFLPDVFREELGLPWTSRHQSSFIACTKFIARVNRTLPRPIREFPWNLVLWDTRRRIRNGHPFV